MFKMWSTRNERPVEGVSAPQYVKIINEFDQLLPYIQNKDIYSSQYKSMMQLFRIVENAKALKEENEFIREDHIDVLIENDDYLLISPLTLKGSLKYGADTKWCTASKSSSYQFTSYTKDGYLFYLISKKERAKNYNKVAFYSRSKNEHLTTYYTIYNQIDTEVNEQKVILNDWTMFELFEIMAKIRVYTYEKYIIEKAKTDVEKTVNVLKSVNLDEFLRQVNLLEKYGESGKIEGKDELEKVIQTLSKKTEDLFGKSKINV